MNEYSIFYNGFTWTCEIEDEDGRVLDTATGNTPIEALENALKMDTTE